MIPHNFNPLGKNGGIVLPSPYKAVKYLGYPSRVTYSQCAIPLVKLQDANRWDLTFKSSDTSGNDVFIGQDTLQTGYMGFISSWTVYCFNKTSGERQRACTATPSITAAQKGSGQWQTVSFQYDETGYAANAPLTIGGYVSGSAAKAKQFSRITCYLNGVLVADYVPAIRTTDTKTGMYDLVGKSFHANTGTEEFEYA